MGNFVESGLNPEPKEIKEIDKELLKILPDLAKNIINDRPENSNFKQNPDNPKEHEPNWHQFGIITHTKEFLKLYENKLPEYLEKWGIDQKINEKLSEKIDGRTKAELLKISIPLHDIGKFDRTFKEIMGELKPDYTNHETKSEKFILEDDGINNILKSYNLTNHQIEYIAQGAGLHYELGKIRSEAKKSNLGYSLAFTESNQCKKMCKKIADEFPNFKEEIGILFLCDSLAKTNISIDVKTDQDIENQTEKIKKIIQERKLDSRLIYTIKQKPVNIATAKRYLETITE